MEQFIQNVIGWLVQVPGWTLEFLNSVPPEVYAVIIASLPFSVLVAFTKTFVQRHWDKVPSDTKMSLINLGGILMMAVGAYLNMTPEQDPIAAIAGIVGATALVQQPFFFRFVKPMVNNFWENWDKSKGLGDYPADASIPADGLPIER